MNNKIKLKNKNKTLKNQKKFVFKKKKYKKIKTTGINKQTWKMSF